MEAAVDQPLPCAPKVKILDFLYGLWCVRESKETMESSVFDLVLNLPLTLTVTHRCSHRSCGNSLQHCSTLSVLTDSCSFTRLFDIRTASEPKHRGWSASAEEHPSIPPPHTHTPEKTILHTAKCRHQNWTKSSPRGVKVEFIKSNQICVRPSRRGAAKEETNNW